MIRTWVCALLVLLVAASGISAQGEQKLEQPPILEEVRALQAAGELAEAESLLRAAVSKRTSQPLTLALAGLLVERSLELDTDSDLGRHLAHGLRREALSLCQELDDRDVDVIRQRAQCHVLLGEYDQAWQVLETGLQAGASPFPLWQDLIAAGVPGQAEGMRSRIEVGREAGELSSLEAAELLLRVAAGEADAELAAAQATILAAGDFDSFTMAYLVWEAHSPQAGMEPLLNLYSRLLAVRPGDPALLFYRGATRFHAGDLAGAESDLAQTLDMESVRAAAQGFLGRVQLRQGRIEAAQATFTALASSEASREGGVLGLVDVAASLGRQRRYEEARSVYQQVIEIDPANEWALLGVPLCFKGAGDSGAADAAYLRALELLPDHAQLLNDRGLLLWGGGQGPLAREVFARAAGAGSVDALENLGMIAFYTDRQPQEAADYFARVLQRNPARIKARFYRELSLGGLRSR